WCAPRWRSTAKTRPSPAETRSTTRSARDLAATRPAGPPRSPARGRAPGPARGRSRRGCGAWRFNARPAEAVQLLRDPLLVDPHDVRCGLFDRAVGDVDHRPVGVLAEDLARVRDLVVDVRALAVARVVRHAEVREPGLADAHQHVGLDDQ